MFCFPERLLFSEKAFGMTVVLNALFWKAHRSTIQSISFVQRDATLFVVMSENLQAPKHTRFFIHTGKAMLKIILYRCCLQRFGYPVQCAILLVGDSRRLSRCFPLCVWEREERMERKAHLPVCSSVSSDWQVDMQFCSWKEDRQGLGMWPTIMFEKNKGLDGVAGDRHVKTSCCSASSIQRESSLEMTQQWSRCIFFDIDLRLKRQRIFCGAVFPFSPSPSLAFTGMTETNIADVSVLLQNYSKIQ